MAKATGKSTSARKAPVAAAKKAPATVPAPPRRPPPRRSPAPRRKPQSGPTSAKKPAQARPPRRVQAGRSGEEDGRRKKPTAKKTATKTPATKKAPAKKAAHEEAGPREEAAAKTRRRRPGQEGRDAGEGRRRPSRRPAAKKAAPVKAKPAPKPKKQPAGKICPLSGIFVPKQSPNISPKTLEKLRELLIEERARHLHQAVELQADADLLVNEREQGDTQFDEESGEGDTISVERERDLMLSANARQAVEEIDRALERMDNGTYGVCVPAGSPHRRRPARGDPVGRVLRGLQAACRAAAPLARSRPVPRWLAPSIVVGVVVLDQLTKIWVVASLSDAPLSIIGDDVELHLDPQQRRRVQPVHERDARARAAGDRAVGRPRPRGATGARPARPWSRSRWCSAARSATSRDRIARSPGFLRGEVVDYVRVGSFPSFNVADSCITIGAILLVIAAFRETTHPTRRRAPGMSATVTGVQASPSWCRPRWRGSGSTARSRC